MIEVGRCRVMCIEQQPSDGEHGQHVDRGAHGKMSDSAKTPGSDGAAHGRTQHCA